MSELTKGLYKIFFTVAGIIVIPFMFVYLTTYIRLLIKGNRRIKFRGEKIKRKSILKRIFFDFPRRLAIDNMRKDPNNLDMYGVHYFCGRQGCGKTLAVVEFLLRAKKRYPDVKVRSNIALKFQDGKIGDWRDLVNNNNGEKGQIEFIDELQNWFNSNESRDFPPEMLTDITQQRKQRKVVLGTTQVFTRVAKPLREQAMLVYRPFTIAGCLTIVSVSEPELTTTGDLRKLHFRKMYFFIHTDEIRNAYDTYERIERVNKSGFQPRNNQLGNSAETNVFMIASKD